MIPRTCVFPRVLVLGAGFLAFNSLRADLWEEEVRPLFQEHCTKCHGGVKQKGGLDLRSIEKALRGSDNGPVIVPGKPDESFLLDVLHAGADPQMPPKGELLSEDQVGMLKQWVAHLSPTTKDEWAGPASSVKTSASAGLNLPQGIDPTLAIDVHLQADWIEREVAPAAPSDDATFVRRIYLDLVGRIPTADEREAFLKDSRSDKRAQLINHLLESSSHALHFAELFNIVFLDREKGRGKSREKRKENGWLDYLEWAFKTNRPWNEIARDLIVARPESDKERGSVWFLWEHNNDHEALARNLAPALLGQQIHCAQCHDHPVVPEIEQLHYWGLVAFFNRSKNVETPQGPGIAEVATGGHIKFSNLEGQSHDALLAFLTGDVVNEESADEERADLYHVPPPDEWLQTSAEPKEDENDRRRGASKVEALPVPIASRREALTEVAIEKNPGFAKAFVNRAWALMFGRGLVHPVDQMDSVHPPSHPELLSWLAKDFESSEYNVRRLLKSIALSVAYQLDSRYETTPLPQPDAFAHALVKPLPAESLYRSLLVASGLTPDENGRFPDQDEEALREQFSELYGALFPESFNANVSEGLFFSNNEFFRAVTGPEEGQLLNRVIHETSCADAIDECFISVLGRLPDEQEKAMSIAYLAEREDRRAEGLRQLIWALMSSAEFRFNH